MTDPSTQGIKIVLHPVSDLERAKAVYTALLGFPPQHDAPYDVGFEAEGQHIGLVLQRGCELLPGLIPGSVIRNAHLVQKFTGHVEEITGDERD